MESGGGLREDLPLCASRRSAYIKALKAPFRHVPLIAAGGVNQQTAGDFIRAGAVALGIGKDLIPQDAITRRQAHRIQELAHRYLTMVRTARKSSAVSNR